MQNKTQQAGLTTINTLNKKPTPCLHQPSRAYLNNSKKHTLNTNPPITAQTVVTNHQADSPRAPKTYSLKPTSSPTALAEVHMTTPMCHPSTLEMNPLCCIAPVLITQDQANSVAAILPDQYISKSRELPKIEPLAAGFFSQNTKLNRVSTTVNHNGEDTIMEVRDMQPQWHCG